MVHIMWGFTYRSDLHDNELTYEEAFQLPTELIDLRPIKSGRMQMAYGYKGLYPDVIKAIRFKANTEEQALKRCLKVIKNFSEWEAEMHRFYDELTVKYSDQYPELFI